MHWGWLNRKSHDKVAFLQVGESNFLPSAHIVFSHDTAPSFAASLMTASRGIGDRTVIDHLTGGYVRGGGRRGHSDEDRGTGEGCPDGWTLLTISPREVGSVGRRNNGFPLSTPFFVFYIWPAGGMGRVLACVGKGSSEEVTRHGYRFVRTQFSGGKWGRGPTVMSGRR